MTSLINHGRMATQVLPLASPHFSHGSEVYAAADMNPYANFQTFQPTTQQGFLYDADQPSMTFPTPDSWVNQSNGLRRMSSRSPGSQHERTPIRHHKMSLSRSRSASKPDALLAYAAEHSSIHHSLGQRQSASTTPSLSQTTPSSSPALYSSQSYSSISPASSYVSQTQFYDNATPSYSNIHGQQNVHSHGLPDFFPVNRQELHIAPLTNTSLGANNALYLRASGQSRQAQMPAMTSTAMNFPSMSQSLESTTTGIEVSSSRNKPQCWDHGCNGRQFSTFSNLLRHQREKSGTAAKARCPHCNTEFTRTTARNGHMYGGKCKGLSDSTKGSPDVGDEATDD